MPLSRTLPWLLLFLLGFTPLAALTGCGAANEEAALRPENTATLSPEDWEVSGVDSVHPAEDEARDVSNPEAEGSGSPTFPETTMVPFVADRRVTIATGPAAPPIAASPAYPATSIPKMAAVEPETVVTPPRLVAPMVMAPAPETAVRVQRERTMSSAMIAPAPAPTPSLDSTAPPLATIRLEATRAEKLDEFAAVEMASPDAVEETASIAYTPVAEDRGDYEAVTVFYGTDRSSTATSGQPAQAHRLWLYGTGVCALLFGLFAVVAMASSRKKTLAGLAVMSFSAGCVMALMGTVAWLQSDRAIAGPKLEYGNGRGTFVMGTCEISIPKSHRVAELESPSVFRLDFVEDPTKHIVLLDIAEKDSEMFFSQLRSYVDRNAAKDAFVFVHGFNVTFKDAARRTAQLAYDLKFQGAPIFYSWPSQGGLFQYAVDETNVAWTVPHLQEFLKEIARRSGAKSVHLIAHSMGNRALTSALRELSHELHGAPPLFHEVVLTAPDIDADIFRRDIAPAIVTTAKRVTLYASSNDEALVLSKQVHGYPRAGETGDALVVIPGIETIDVSAVDTSLLGHNYYGDNATVISDMIDLVRNSKSAQQRSWLVTARLNDLLYWVFRVDRGTVGAAPVPAASRY
jgi:esterase/lipase superfamily enzyme